MTAMKFHEILKDEGFTLKEILKLQVAALENAEDAHNGMDLSEEYLASIGRDFIIDQLYDMCEFDDNGIITNRDEFNDMFLGR